MEQWLGWDDPRYDITTQYWRHIFPTMQAFTKWSKDYLSGKPWQVRWETTDKLLKQLTAAMVPYHDLSKDDQKLPDHVAQIQFIRAQCVYLQQVRSELAIEYHKADSV